MHDLKARLAGGAVFFLPLILIQAVSLFADTGPAVARGGDGGAAPPAPPAPLRARWSAAQRAAADRITALRGQPFGPSPLAHLRRAEGPDTGPSPDDRPPPPPRVVVQMILASRGGDVALIDRRRYRVGDPIGDDGWVVAGIDGEKRSVTLEHPPSGRRARLFVPLPR